jgi:hypothetical protein
VRSLIACLALLFGATLALACEDDEERPTATPSPPTAITATPQAIASPVATLAVTASATPSPPRACDTRIHAPSGPGDYEGWLTYTNDVYGYEFKYPPGATVTEAPESSFTLSWEDQQQGLTFHDVYERYTGKICVRVNYKIGFVTISAPENREMRHVICGRTSRAFEGPDLCETLSIDGETYTAGGFEERGPGETTDYHNEYMVVVLDDKTQIGYGTGPTDTATFEDYLEMRGDLVKIIESYRKLE